MLYMVIVSLLLIQCYGIIYRLNETEYNKMPPLFALDDYSSCLLEPGGIYCVVDAELFSTEHSDLIDMIKEYSVQKVKHYNHTQIHRGICLPSSCKDFLNNTDIRALDQKSILERCLNKTMYETYNLQGKVVEIRYCNKHGDVKHIDIYDVMVAVIFLILIVMNIIGSFYEIYWCKDAKEVNPFLLAFSIRRNWKKFTTPVGGADPRFNRLKLFHGLRAMTMICVIFSHTLLMIAYSYVANPLFIERSYENPLKLFLYNGTLVIHTFFVMSSFLLAYNFQIHSEKHGIHWIQWPKGILLRWLRLTPTYAIVLAVLCTWWRFLGDGPLWRLVIQSETDACRQYWWAHLLYINNYIFEDNQCMPQTWYVAADTQLYCLGLFICVAARSSRARKLSLLLLLSLSLVIVASHTYFQNLGALVHQAPESYRNFYGNNDNYRLFYIRGHTNMSAYVLGLAGGFLTYHWQESGKNLAKHKFYRFGFWMSVPLGVAVILSGGLFYIDGLEPAIGLTVLYATFYKIIFQSLVVLFIIGVIFKLETVYRGIVEWRGFTWAGRVSYSAYLLHTFFERGLVGIHTTPIYVSDYYFLNIMLGNLFLTFVSAAGLFIFVESPLNGITKALLTARKNNSNQKNTQINNN